MSTSNRRTTNQRPAARRQVSVQSTGTLPPWTKWVALVLVAVILLAAGSFARNQRGLMAVINGERIVEDDLTRLMSYYMINYPDLDLSNAYTRSEIYYMLILNTARAQLFPSWQIAVSDAEIDEQYRETIRPALELTYLLEEADHHGHDYDYYALLYGSDEEIEEARAELEEHLGTTGAALFDEALAEAKFSEQQYKEMLRRDMQLVALDEAIAATIEVGEDEVLDRYQTVKADRSSDAGPKMGISHILLSTKDDDGNPIDEEAEDEVINLIYELQRRLNEEGADFAELAEEYSDDPGSAVDGGSLGMEYTENAMYQGLVYEFAAAAAALREVGELSEVIKSDYGYHIIRLDSIREQSLDEVQELLQRQLVAEKNSEKHRQLLDGFIIEPEDHKEILSMGW